MFDFIRNAITKYKVARMHAVINEYFGAVHAHNTYVLPRIVQYARDSLGVVVEKTAERPEVAINLVNALEAAAKHYGPALVAESKKASAEIEKCQNFPMLKDQCDHFAKAFDGLITDIKP